MALFNVGFSEGGIIIPACTVEAPTVEEAVQRAWFNNAATLERAEAVARGDGTYYRFLRDAGEWRLLSVAARLPEM